MKKVRGIGTRAPATRTRRSAGPSTTMCSYALSREDIAALAKVSSMAATAFAETERRMAEAIGAAIPLAKGILELYREHEAKLWETIQSVVESPRFKVFRKMMESRGVLDSLPAEHNVFFVPEAVLDYGFAHLPTQSDPEGKLVQQLPAIPSGNPTALGAYLYFPKNGDRRLSVVNPEMDPAYVLARQVYEQYKPRGIDPAEVLRAVRMDAGIETVWLAIDTAIDLKAQVAELKRWLGRTQRALYGRPGARRASVPNAPRSVLIFTLSASAHMKVREIARVVYPKEAAGLEDAHAARQRRAAGDPLEARVRQTLKEVGRALKGVSLEVPTQPKR